MQGRVKTLPCAAVNFDLAERTITMGREFELKYAAAAADLEILKARYPQLRPITMETVYYDDPEGVLSRMHWTLRRRMENEISVCSLKTPAGGLARGEWEVECDDILEAIPMLCEMGAPVTLIAMTVRGLKSVCGARFTRLAGPVQAGDSVVELALDAGVFLGGGKEEAFTEVEVELKEGSEADAVAFGEALAKEMGLTEEFRSKVGRARALAGI